MKVDTGLHSIDPWKIEFNELFPNAYEYSWHVEDGETYSNDGEKIIKFIEERIRIAHNRALCEIIESCWLTEKDIDSIITYMK